MKPTRIALVGLGKIAQDQHWPTIAASDAFDLVSAASLAGESPRGKTYRDVAAMLAAEPEIEAVALCQPPQARFAAAHAALMAGKHVLLEKPPGATLSEVSALIDVAREKGVTLFAAWHSRFAAGVAPAKAWLAGRALRSVAITWKEDVRVWHPGQTWIWQPGGLGVFDPGINALSIATNLLPPFHLVEGRLATPCNQAAPIRASLRFAAGDVPITAELDFLQTGPQTWDIAIDTDDGTLLLSKGGAELTIAGVSVDVGPQAEYRGVYDRFAELIAAGQSEVDLSPFRHVADAFLRAGREETEAFTDEAAAA